MKIIGSFGKSLNVEQEQVIPFVKEENHDSGIKNSVHGIKFP